MEIIHDYGNAFKYIADYRNNNIIKVAEKIATVDCIIGTAFFILDHFEIRNRIFDMLVLIIAPVFGLSIWLVYILLIAPFVLSVIKSLTKFERGMTI